MPTLYKSMVRPHLEYGNAIWGPFYKTDIDMVESVQKRATKLIDTLKDKPYEDRLIALDLPSMTYRRKRGDTILMYKLINGLVRPDFNKFFLHPCVCLTQEVILKGFSKNMQLNGQKSTRSRTE